MAYLQALALLLLGLVVWGISKRLIAGKIFLAEVAGPPKEHWLKGNLHRVFQDGLEYNLQLQETYGGAVRIHALLGGKLLIVSDPRALQYIVGKEQHIYEETDMFITGNKLVFGEGLISTLGEQHRKQRRILNPVFSLANMRDLLPVVQPISNKLRDIIVSQLPPDGGTAEINVLPWMSRTALEYVGLATLGYSFNALDVSKHDEYTEAVRNLGPTAIRLVLFRTFVPALVRTVSLYWRNKIVDYAPLPGLRELRRIVNVMDAASKRILAQRKAEVASGGKGKDIMSLMLHANAASDAHERLTEDEILGQMNTFVFAGFENTAGAVARLLYILASKHDVQRRLRSEIRNAKRNYAEEWPDVCLPYDVLVGLPYLDAIVRETLRVHPPTSLFGRTAKHAATLPLEYPVRSASGTQKDVTSIPLQAGTNIIISILAANHNKRVWGEDASEWKPERWLSGEGEKADGVKYPGVYCSMMTFMGGGRACIGFKFAEMEMKQVLATLLSHVHLSLSPSKEIYWKISALQIPVVRGDKAQVPQVPLNVRLVRKEDFA